MKTIILAVCVMVQLARMEPHLISSSPPSTITPTAAAVQSTSSLLHTITSTMGNSTDIAIPSGENSLKASMPPQTQTTTESTTNHQNTPQESTLKLVFLLFLVVLLVVAAVGFFKQNRMPFGYETVQVRSSKRHVIRNNFEEDEETESGKTFA